MHIELHNVSPANVFKTFNTNQQKLIKNYIHIFGNI